MAKKSIFREQEQEGFFHRYYRKIIVVGSAIVVAVIGTIMFSEAVSVFNPEPDHTSHRSSTTPNNDWLIVTSSSPITSR